jgi:hypothetical protein
MSISLQVLVVGLPGYDCGWLEILGIDLSGPSVL